MPPDRLVEQLDWFGSGRPFVPGFIPPDAPAVVVGEEEGAVVARGVRRDARARSAGCSTPRRTIADAAVPHPSPGTTFAAVVVGVHGRLHRARALGVEVLADTDVRAVVSRLTAVALVARPPEVERRGERRGVGDRVDLLPVVPADVAQPDLVRAAAHGEAERVAHSVGDDALLVLVGTRLVEPRVAGHTGAGVGIDADDGARERDLARRALLAPWAGRLGAERAALRVDGTWLPPMAAGGSPQGFFGMTGFDELGSVPPPWP